MYSYMTLRNLIGLSGMLLPFVLLWTTRRSMDDILVEPSISDYYYTSNGDVLVVLLSVLGVFLFTYKGYDHKWLERGLTLLAAVCAIGIAFSPTATKRSSDYSVHSTRDEVPSLFGLEQHLIFAALFFVSLAVISLVYFPRTDKSSLRTAGGQMTQKAKRNVVFIVCGWIMVACVVLLFTYFAFASVRVMVGDFPVIFTLETVAVEAFGLSWLTKGETLWPDGEHYMVTGYRQVKDALKEKF